MLDLHAKKHVLFWHECSRNWVTTEPEILERAIASAKKRGIFIRPHFMPSSIDRAGVVFDAIDGDSSGKIDAKELCMLMMSFGVGMDELAQILEEMSSKIQHMHMYYVCTF